MTRRADPAIAAAPGHPEILRILAPNPGPMSLEGTNTYLVGSDPAYVIDPGPAIEAHLGEIRDSAAARGGIEGILLTHSHADHSEAVPELDAPLLWGTVSDGAEFVPSEDSEPAPEPPSTIGPFSLVPTPGHAADHVAFVLGEVCFCGDLVLGEGSSIVPPAAFGGSLADYMRSLERLRELGPRLMCPGHGPWITDPAAKLAEYTAHRNERERKLVAALEAGERSRRALLDAAWDDVAEAMRPAAALAMQAHLEKLEAEGLLPGELID